MGLDMYLDREIWVGAPYEHRKVTGTIDLYANGKKIEVDLHHVSAIIERVAYWRKANAIHGWIVKNYANGVDDCKNVNLTAKDLVELRELCASILAKPAGASRDQKAMELLPPQAGFFFGSTKTDDWYYEDLEFTVKVLSDITADDDRDYIYHASW